MKAVRQVIVSNGVPCFQMRSVGSHSTSGRKEGKDGLYSIHCFSIVEYEIIIIIISSASSGLSSKKLNPVSYIKYLL